MKERCEICYYRFSTAGHSDGICRRYPPVIDFESKFTTSVYPVIMNHFWCGEFKHKDKLIDLIAQHKPKAHIIDIK